MHKSNFLRRKAGLSAEKSKNTIHIAGSVIRCALLFRPRISPFLFSGSFLMKEGVFMSGGLSFGSTGINFKKSNG